MDAYLCARCGRKIKVRPARGGDGSEVRPCRHNRSDYSTWHVSGPCDGHLYEETEWVEPNSPTPGDQS